MKWRRDAGSTAFVGGTFLTVNIFASATYNVFAKALSGSLPPMAMLFVSESLTLFFALLFFGTFPTIRHLVRLDRRSILPMLAIGVTNGIVAPLLWFTGLQYTTAVNAVLFGNAEMVFLIVFAVLFLKEKWTHAHTMSIAAISFGIVIIGMRGFTEGVQLRMGDILLILASCSFATGSFIFRKLLNHADARLVLFMRSLLPVVVFFLLSPFATIPFITELRVLPLTLIPALIGFGLISRFMNTFTFYQAMERLKVTTVSLVSNLTLIVGVVFAHFILNEPVYGYHWIGGIFVVLGTLLLELTGSHPAGAHMEPHLTERKISRG